MDGIFIIQPLGQNLGAFAKYSIGLQASMVFFYKEKDFLVRFGDVTKGVSLTPLKSRFPYSPF